jgi:hypothetical protein
VKRWRTKALDRAEWATIIREAKTNLKGPWGYRKKKNLLPVRHCLIQRRGSKVYRTEKFSIECGRFVKR